jgi:cytochrome c2
MLRCSLADTTKVLLAISLFAASIFFHQYANAQNVSAGEKAFRKCKACHAVAKGAKKKPGPHLNKLIGRVAGTLEDYKYSSAMKAAGKAGIEWNSQTLDQFLMSPKTFIKGIKMTYAGVKKDTERANLIAYLGSLTGESTSASPGEPANAPKTSQTAAVSPAKEEPPVFDEAYMNDPANFEIGKKFWFAQCTHCHGFKAYPGKAPKLKPHKYKAAFVFKRLTRGFKKMPAWKEVFTKEERMTIVAYVMNKNFSP